MITNSSLTVYHKGYDYIKRIETWTRYNYNKVWWFGGKGTSTNAGYENANDVQVRIAYEYYDNLYFNDLDISNFEIGDIIVEGNLDFDIETQQDLKNYKVYNITSITNNLFGNNPHIHLSGK